MCGNYTVFLDGKHNPGKDGPGLLSAMISLLASKVISRSQPSESQQPMALLNVRCGVSVGLMAGLDIGFQDRWEHFVNGDAIGDVAKSEYQAEKDDVVISSLAHQLLHSTETDICTELESGSTVLACGCTTLRDSCFKVQPIKLSSPLTTLKVLRDRNSPQSRFKEIVDLTLK